MHDFDFGFMDGESNVYVRLKTDSGLWHCGTEGYARGTAFVGGRMLSGADLLEYCAGAVCAADADRRLSALNGCFSVIVTKGGVTYLIADKMKTCALFYFMAGGRLHVTDDAGYVLTAIPHVETGQTERLFFVSCGYLDRGDTLVKGCRLVGPAEVVCFDGARLQRHEYCSREQARSRIDVSGLEACGDVVRGVAERLKAFAGGRTVVIPLSGGYDSRLVACMCKICGMDNVVCYTYGIGGSSEVSTASAVAEKLGFPLVKIESSLEKWKKLIESSLVEEYLRYGGNLGMIAHLQDFFAVYELKTRRLVPPGSVFVPGHTGDLLAGNHFPETVDRHSLARYIYDKYFVINILSRRDKRQVMDSLQKVLERYNDLGDREKCYEAIYRWNIDFRQPNYIINSVRAYEFFGYSWALPLWDDGFVRFWSSIDCVQRRDERLYERCLFDTWFLPLGVGFRKKESGALTPFQKFSRRLLSSDARYRLKEAMADAGLYTFPPDNFQLDAATGLIRGLGQAHVPGLSVRRNDSMSAKSLYYLGYIESFGR